MAKKIPRNRHVSVEIEADTYSSLWRLAMSNRVSVGFIIRGIVLAYLEDHPVEPLSPSDQEAVDE